MKITYLCGVKQSFEKSIIHITCIAHLVAVIQQDVDSIVIQNQPRLYCQSTLYQ
jgi:hypothetical protein